MSRSYKKNPCVTAGNSSRVGKKYANKKVRRSSNSNIFNYGGYKKIYSQYNICDYRWLGFFRDYMQFEINMAQYFNELKPIKKEMKYKFYKCYEMK